MMKYIMKGTCTMIGLIADPYYHHTKSHMDNLKSTALDATINSGWWGEIDATTLSAANQPNRTSSIRYYISHINICTRWSYYVQNYCKTKSVFAFYIIIVKWNAEVGEMLKFKEPPILQCHIVTDGPSRQGIQAMILTKHPWNNTVSQNGEN